MVGRIVRPYGPETAVGAPERQSAGVGLGIAVGPRAGNDPEAGGLGGIEQALNVLGGAGKVEDAGCGGVVRPEEVDAGGSKVDTVDGVVRVRDKKKRNSR